MLSQRFVSGKRSEDENFGIVADDWLQALLLHILLGPFEVYFPRTDLEMVFRDAKVQPGITYQRKGASAITLFPKVYSKKNFC